MMYFKFSTQNSQALEDGALVGGWGGGGETLRSAKVMANWGDQETRGQRSTVRPLNSREQGPSTLAPKLCSALPNTLTLKPL